MEFKHGVLTRMVSICHVEILQCSLLSQHLYLLAFQRLVCTVFCTNRSLFVPTNRNGRN
jgi:hypothetical protein